MPPPPPPMPRLLEPPPKLLELLWLPKLLLPGLVKLLLVEGLEGLEGELPIPPPKITGRLAGLVCCAGL